MKEESCNSFRMSLCLIAIRSTITEIRSTISACKAATRTSVAVRPFLISKRLSNRKKELEMTDGLLDGRARGRSGRSALEQLQRSALESLEARRIDAVREIQSHGSDRCFVAQSESRGVHHVVEIGKAVLPGAERNVAQRGINVPRVVEQHAADVVADQGEPKLHVIEEQRVSTQRESCGKRSRTTRLSRLADVPRPRLILRKSA